MTTVFTIFWLVLGIDLQGGLVVIPEPYNSLQTCEDALKQTVKVGAWNNDGACVPGQAPTHMHNENWRFRE